MESVGIGVAALFRHPPSGRLHLLAYAKYPCSLPDRRYPVVRLRNGWAVGVQRACARALGLVSRPPSQIRDGPLATEGLLNAEEWSTATPVRVRTRPAKRAVTRPARTPSRPPSVLATWCLAGSLSPAGSRGHSESPKLPRRRRSGSRPCCLAAHLRRAPHQSRRPEVQRHTSAGTAPRQAGTHCDTDPCHRSLASE